MPTPMPQYFLSSLDSYVLEPTRVCKFTSFARFNTGKECVLATVAPPIPGEPFGLSEDISRVLLSIRHEGDSLSAIAEFPCFVHVARLLREIEDDDDAISSSEVESIAWGELYRSQYDAEHHVFDNGGKA
jgi:hypothetical protein